MKTTKRTGVFETNSSSSHSISIHEGATVFDTIAPDADGIITLEGGEFGWEVESYSGAYTKANYCAIDTKGVPYMREMLEEVLKEHTGAKEIVYDFGDEWKSKNYSYIDHQSDGTSHEAFSSKEKLKAFIFSPDSVLYTDNDNH